MTDEKKLMLTQFRIRYPQGCLMSELVTIDHGKYIVRALVQVDGTILATGLAAADSVEQAEDKARARALDLLNLNSTAATVSEATERQGTQPQKNAPAITDESHKANRHAVAPTQKSAEPNPLKALLSDTPEIPKTPKSSLSEPQLSEKDPATITPQSNSNGLSIEESFAQAVPEPDIPLPVKEMPLQPPLSDDNLSEQPAKTKESTLSTTEVIDFSDVIARSNVELKRLGWTSEQGRNYLLQTYGKRSRQLLSDEELLEFLQYLESQPSPMK